MALRFKKHVLGKNTKQFLGLFSVNIIGIPIGLITSIIITNYLGPQLYGDYKFINSIFNFALVFLTFGFFQACNRAIVLCSDSQKIKEYYGAELLLMIVIFIVMSLCLVIYAYYDNNIAEKGVFKYLLYVIPFGWIFLFQRLYEILLPANNNIKQLGMIRLLPRIGHLIAVMLIYYVFKEKNFDRLAVVLFLYLFFQAVVYIYSLFKMGFSFRNAKYRIKEIWSYNKSFGFNVYLGSLFAVGFANLTDILISYFGIDNSGVGFYSLALTFSSPLSFIPNTIATTHYKNFASQKKISTKLLLITIGISFLSMFCLWILIGPFVRFFYGEAFINVISLNYIVSLGVIFYGIADFFNRYLGANGQGKALRNGSFLVGFALLIMNLILIPKFGEYGAAYTKIIAGIVYLSVMLLYYFKYIRNINDPEVTHK